MDVLRTDVFRFDRLLRLRLNLPGRVQLLGPPGLCEGVAQVEEYIVPNLDQCGSCHERDDTSELLGVITHQLNMEIEVDGQPTGRGALAEKLTEAAGHRMRSEGTP